MVEYVKTCCECGSTYTMKRDVAGSICITCRHKAYVKKNYEKMKERMKTDPEYKKRMVEHRHIIHRRRYDRLKNDPEFKERNRRQSYKYYIKNHEKPEFKAHRNAYQTASRKENPERFYANQARHALKYLSKEQRLKIMRELDEEK